MDAPHRLDLTRLPILKQAQEAALGAQRKASDALNELTRERGNIIREIEALKLRVPGSYSGGAEKKRKLDVLASKRAELTEKIKEATAVQDDLAERSQAAGHLFNECTKFVEGDR